MNKRGKYEGVRKSKATPAKIAALLAVVVLVLAAVFLLGRYGWKIGGFRVCQSAGIDSVEVRDSSVRLTGFYPGSFAEGFCGYYAEERDATLYVGFRFSPIFGFFETGDFDITIPVGGDIQEVIIKSAKEEHTVWSLTQEAPTETIGPEAVEVPAQTIAPETVPPTTEVSAAVPEPYAEVLESYYTALHDGWDPAQLMEAGLNYMTADGFFEMPMEEIGYGVTDLDGDAVEEMVIGSLKEDAFYGKLIFCLYTLDDAGNPLLLLDSTERNRYYYAGDIRFANLGSSGWNESFVTTLKLERRELVDMTYTTDPADYVQMELTPFSQWRR